MMADNVVLNYHNKRPTRQSLSHFEGSLHSQSLDWYWQTKQYRKIHKLYTSQKANLQNTAKKLPWFSHLLQHSATKLDGLILQSLIILIALQISTDT